MVAVLNKSCPLTRTCSSRLPFLNSQMQRPPALGSRRLELSATTLNRLGPSVGVIRFLSGIDRTVDISTVTVGSAQARGKAVYEDASRRQATARFGVSPASATRWQWSSEQEAGVAAEPLDGDRRSQHVEAHADLILSLRGEQPTLILSESRALLAESSIATSESSLSHFFRRSALTQTKDIDPRRRAAAA